MDVLVLATHCSKLFSSLVLVIDLREHVAKVSTVLYSKILFAHLIIARVQEGMDCTWRDDQGRRTIGDY